MSKKLLTVVAVLLLTSIYAYAGCGEPCNKKTANPCSAASSTDAQNAMQASDSKPMQQKMKMAGTMSQVKTAEALYTCPMHPEVVSADAKTLCPLCNMKLTKMTDDKVKALQVSNPKGCPMDPIVVEGTSKTSTCSVCNMKLDTIVMNDQKTADCGSDSKNKRDGDCKDCAK